MSIFKIKNELRLSRPLATGLVFAFSISVAILNNMSLIIHGDPSPIWWYYSIIFNLCGGLVGWVWRSSPRNSLPLIWGKKELVVLILILWLIMHLSLQSADDHIMWLDEYTHAIQALREPGNGSTAQQQPILSYLVSYSFIKIIGTTMTAIRLTS